MRSPLPAPFTPSRTLAALCACAPLLAHAQSSPFMTGATALQTNILAWLTPIAVILVMALGAMAMANRMQLKMEQRGVRSELAERLRTQYRERLQRRMQRTPQTTPAAPQVSPQPVKEAGLRGTQVVRPAPTQDLEEIRRQAREAWLRMRPRQAHAADAERTAREREAEQPLHPSEDELAR
jgi:hypothetical protein